MGADKLAAVATTGASVLTAGRHLVPDAPRRHAVAGRVAGPGHAPGRDPRRRRARRDGTASPAAATRRRRRPSPARRRSRRPRGRRSPTRSCGRTWPRDDDDPRPSAPRAVAERADWEALRLAGAAIKDEVIARPARAARAARGDTSPPRAGRCTGRATRPRPTPIVARLVRERRRRRGDQGQVDGHPGDRAQRGPGEGRASPPGRPTSPSSSCSSAHDLPSHILVPAIHRNRREIREIFEREMARAGRPAPADLTDEPRALAEAARLHLRREVPAREGRDLRRELRASPRPAP